MKPIHRLLQILNLWRLVPVYFMMHHCKNSDLILEELDYWTSITDHTDKHSFDNFSYIILLMKEYRNLLCYRMRGGISQYIVRLLFPQMDTLYINTPDIGKCLFIQHGFSTIISAKSIGSYCWINQQVTIGQDYDPKPPVIGNGVCVCAGAKVIGNVHIGDNCIIGANAVVVKSLDEGLIVGGVPAKTIGTNTDHILYKDN